jgi:hypothetical protein
LHIKNDRKGILAAQKEIDIAIAYEIKGKLAIQGMVKE